MIMVEEQMNYRMDHQVHDNGGITDTTPLPKRFPFRLNKMLNDAEAHGNDHIVSWMPDGKMFKVHKHKEFANNVMPLYCRHTRYKSFLRQLSMYKFQRVNEGPLRGCYHHPNFAKDRFDLIDKINRKDRGDGDSSSVSCSSSPPTTHSRNMSGAIVSVRKRRQEHLSGSDSDTAVTEENDFESINIPVQDSTRVKKDGKTKKPKSHESTERVPKTEMEIPSSACSTAVRITDPFFDSVRKIGRYPTGLFDLRDDISTNPAQAQLTSSSQIIEPVGMGSHHQPSKLTRVGETLQLPSSTVFELSQPYHSGDSTDILDEIIKTFKTTPPDP